MMSKELQAIDLCDINEDALNIMSSLQQLRQWIKSQPHILFCRLDSNFLLRFLRSKKFNIVLAQEMLDKYLSMRTLYPKWYQNLDITDPAIENLIDSGFVFPLPQKDLKGRRVIFSIGNTVNYTKPTDSDTMRAMVMTFEALLEEEYNQVRGFTYIFDFKGVGLTTVSIWSPSEFQKAFSISEKAFPMKHKEINFINLPFLINTGIEIFKSFMSAKLKNRLMCHSDINKLAQVVPKRILPKEYGGEEPMADMIKCWKQELLQKRDNLMKLDQMRIFPKHAGNTGLKSKDHKFSKA